MEIWYDKIIAALVTTIAGGVIFIIRSVTTNTKKIELLEAEMRNRDRERETYLRELEEIRSNLKDLQSLLQQILLK